jgi:hypothetical protein
VLVLWVLLVSMGLFRAAGALGVAGLDSWVAATRWALGVMLLFTASAHFTSMKEDLVRMWLRAPMQLLFIGLTAWAGFE